MNALTQTRPVRRWLRSWRFFPFVRMLALALGAALLVQARAKEASVVAYCLSASFGPGSARADGKDLVVWFTTYDGSSGFPWVDTYDSSGVVSGEFAEDPTHPGDYRSDYLLVVDEELDATGTLAVTLPTGDADRNGVPDFLQANRNGSLSLNGTVTPELPFRRNSQPLSGSVTRPAGSREGTYEARVEDPELGTITYRGGMRVVNFAGDLTYDRSDNSASLRFEVESGDGSTVTLTGHSSFTVQSADTVLFPPMTLVITESESLQMRAFSLVRDGNRYLGTFEFEDGDPMTSWRDYFRWRMELVDTNDADHDGIPDFSDSTVVVPPPGITVQPESRTVAVGESVVFSVSASGGLPLYYQWRKDGADLPGGTGSYFAIAAAQVSDSGGYTVVVSNSGGSVTSMVATLVVMEPPAITGQPRSKTVNLGEPTLFGVAASGSPPLAYQWYHDGRPVEYATGATHYIVAAGLGDAGDYYAVVTNPVGSAISAVATLTVVVVPPSITGQPRSKTVNVGDPTQFGVTAGGSGPLTYQWYHDGRPVEQATGATHYIPAAGLGDAGDYYAVVTNPAGSATSVVATLTVLGPPVITGQPRSKAVTEGQPALFGVTATGAEPISFQWTRDGVPLPGATSATCVIPAVTAADAGEYQVLVSNRYGTASSVVATLTVLSLPRIPELTLSPPSPDGKVRLEIRGEAGRPYRLLSGTDLVSWVEEAQGVLQGLENPVEWVFPVDPEAPSRFWKIAAP